ncbi:hypothetical protein GH714_031242 [Hevea brasiliensis]|uniref:RNase H type-1 domain-containing protein n=1 Tax=Hevea brasiliensis TaxID=3981 RepID=A0A6A6K7T0_HEVBR|nr:hypothetical protein GH714_031242 [Hevea brasiliensis]
MKGKVRDFVSKEGIWNWSKFDVFLPPNVLLVIAAIPPPSDDAGEDVVLWGGTASGSFSVKSTYSNKRIFSDENVSVEGCISFISVQVRDFMKALILRKVSRKCLSDKEVRHISWEPPADGWEKLNVDGAVKGAYKHAYAILEGLNLAWRRGCKKLIVECDNLEVISMLKGNMEPHAFCSSLIYSILDLVKRDWELDFRHIYREANKCADWLAQWAVSLNQSVFNLLQPPTGLNQWLLHDHLKVAYSRTVIAGV